VQWAAREFAQIELADHKYVMVLHDHQANPHVHISVRAESKHGKRLNPRKADLHRWRETFAGKLRERGVDAEATRQATRGNSRNYEPLWRIKAGEEGRLLTRRAPAKVGARASAERAVALEAWMQIGAALVKSGDPANLRLAASIKEFVQGTEVMLAVTERGKPRREGPSLGLAGARSAPDAPWTIDRRS
jgi:type IV secretory pathway VirD2 relaxase